MADGRPAAAGWWMAALAGLVGVLIGAVAMAAASGYFVRSYLLEHPEVLPEAMERLQQRETAQAVEQNRAALETPFHGAWAGAADADVVLVEFYDYACGFCRQMNPVVERLIAEDPKLKVVWREFPVLGPASEEAAVASLAAAEAGRFKAFHERLFELGRPSAETIAAARAAVNLPEPTLTPAYEQELRRNYQLAEALRANGTPTFVVGDQVFRGAVGYEVLKEAIGAARRN
ncbi:MAG: DsbA family protein [Allosphingosinicella sp.]|uniref:DsbA family protein n=1 Tax=Allosphingosinicella sp. TaxID=2823234 RepID=UPI00393B8563